MLFHKFKNQEERKAFGGGDFMEIQVCTLPAETPLSRIVNDVEYWFTTSLYICGDDWNEFCDEYDDIITGGVYNNLDCGSLDPYGINYFSKEKTDEIIDRLKAAKPKDYEILLEWLLNAKEYNGFYFLGV